MKQLAFFFLFGLATVATGVEKPNIVVILCDDLGYGDLACYGHPHIKTPHLDEMARQGALFTSFYSAAPVCSPSRVGLLTGRAPNRAGVYDWIPEYSKKRHARTLPHMRSNEITIPQLLKDAGYATCMSGKWHCNSKFNSGDQPQPHDFGFDHWFATHNNAAPSHKNPVNFVRNGRKVGKLEGFSCQIVADEAIEWLRGQHEKNAAQPFFLYVAYHEPHEPVASPPDLVQTYLDVAENEDEAQYFANAENLDAATGRLLAALHDLGVDDNTLVIFSSDNGPETLLRYPGMPRSYGTPGPLRGMKLHTHEGGYRVAGIMRWPGRIEGGMEIDAPVSSLDFLPTFCKLAGVDLPDRKLDGADFLPVLEGGPVEREKPLAWCYYHAINDARVSLRDGDWKILGKLRDLPRKAHLTKKDEALIRSTGFESYEVYHIAEDIDESEDLSRSGEAPVESLTSKLNGFYKDLAQSQVYWDVQ